MVDYNKGKIYSIRSAQTNKVYIGSTVEPLARRLSSHRYKFKQWKNGKHHYVSSFELLQYDDYYIELVENYPCLCKEELERHEGQITRAAPNYVNKRIEGRTDAEYYVDNMEHIKQIQKQYREDNKLDIQQKYKQYQKDNAEKLSEQHKQYYVENKQQIQQYYKHWREDNKLDIQRKQKQYREENKEKLGQKHTCECGGKYTHQSKAKHIKTKKHTAFAVNNIVV